MSLFYKLIGLIEKYVLDKYDKEELTVIRGSERNYQPSTWTMGFL
ncbi:hypothetical protein SMD22_17940 [Brevibacillus halotolerans]|nr:hypothetical protein [Brevibacillus sp. 7WMA2]WPS86374.1 hypothetical protein SMD22_17940 [Brevibacillus halotolerans]